MSEKISVFVYDTEPKAEEAKQFLITGNFPEGGITVEQIKFFNYDAAKLDGGLADVRRNKFVVIGHK